MGGYTDTRINGEDFAITPYFSLVAPKRVKLYGICLTWGFWSVYLGIGMNVPRSIKSFLIIKP